MKKVFKFYLELFTTLGWYAKTLNGDAIFGSNFSLVGYSYLVMSLLLGMNFFSFMSYLSYEIFNQTLSYSLAIGVLVLSLAVNYIPYKTLTAKANDTTKKSGRPTILTTLILLLYIIATIYIVVSVSNYIRLENVGYL